MTGRFSAAARPRPTRRIMNIVAAAAAPAVFLAAAVASNAQSSSTSPIRIPPAQLLSSRPAFLPSPATVITPEPRALLPSEVQVLRDSQGTGVAMYGALNGKAASATGVVLAVFANSGAFDPIPAPHLVLADQDDRRAQALFTASLHGAPAIGLAVVALNDTGGDVTVFYDSADAFALSFPRLRQTLAQDGVVEIGRSDNSVCESQTAGESQPNAGWDAAIVAIAKAEPAQIDDSLTQALVSKLSSDTGAPWRIVTAADIR